MAEVVDTPEAAEDSSFQAMAMELSDVLLPDCPATFPARPFLASYSHWKLK